MAKKSTWLHYWPEGNGKAKPGYVLHHIDIEMKTKNKARYDEWRIGDVIMLLREDHSKLHAYLQKRTEETKKKISATLKGYKHDEKFSETLSIAFTGHRPWNKGRFWWNDGNKSVMSYDCPEGFVKGRLSNK